MSMILVINILQPLFFIILLEDFTAKELFFECDMVLRGHD